MSDKIKTGNQGEGLAADFLQKNGYEIIARNYRHKHSEIDLIVKKNNVLVFVEVKSRSSTQFGDPEMFVDNKKANKIFEGADEFIHTSNWQSNIRFDIVSITLKPEIKIEHFEDAFH